MAKKQAKVPEKSQPEKPKTLEKEPEKTDSAPKPNLPMTRTGFEIRNIDEGFRFAQFLAGSTIVPDNYRGKPNDCLVALDLSARLGAPWLAIMQHVYVVHGRIGMDAALGTALTNRSGIFTDPLEYEVVGDDADKPDYKVRAFATRKSTGTVLYGPWITWKLVKAEGWDTDKQLRNGSGIIKSKWNTMPEQMFHYRAASWFQRRHCPEVTMGMLTIDEAEEIPPKHIDSVVVEPGVDGLKQLLNDRATPDVEKDETGNDGNTYEENEQVDESQRDAEMEAKVKEEKEKLQMVGAGGRNKSNLF